MRIAMMGTGTFAEPTFEALLSAFGADVVGLVTQPDRDAGSRRGSTRQTGKGMATIAAAHGVPVVRPDGINTPDGLAQLRELRPDVLVVAAYGQILSRDVLATPAVVTINVHASLLPKYRGAAPVAYAIWKGETETGVSIIKVTPGLDSGDVLSQAALPIGPDETAGELEARLSTLGAGLAVDVVKRIAAGGSLGGERQDPAQVTKSPKLKKEDGLIDWSKPAAEVCRQVRAMQPWPTAYTFLHRPGKEPMRVIINSVGGGGTCSYPLDRVPTFGAVWSHNGELEVTVGGGLYINVLELQPTGKKRMSIVEFLRGYPIPDGSRFGPEVLS